PTPLPLLLCCGCGNCLRSDLPHRGRRVLRIRLTTSVRRARSRPQLARAAGRNIACRASCAPRPTPSDLSFGGRGWGAGATSSRARAP
ncbi:hypothetical protein FB107DRAFT_225380, partial [Schizophyllum commune]